MSDIAIAIYDHFTRKDDERLAQLRAKYIEQIDAIEVPKHKWNIRGQFDDPISEGYSERLADVLVDILRRFESDWFVSLDAGPGWYRILADLHLALVEILPNYTLYQVKEKFGGLRWYDSCPIENSPIQHKDVLSYIHNALVSHAEYLCSRTCEQCGRIGAIYSDNSWYRARCQNHGLPEEKEEE